MKFCQLNEEYTKRVLHAYTDQELIGEYACIQAFYQTLDLTFHSSWIYEFLDEFEPLVGQEIIARYFESVKRGAALRIVTRKK